MSYTRIVFDEKPVEELEKRILLWRKHNALNTLRKLCDTIFHSSENKVTSITFDHVYEYDDEGGYEGSFKEFAAFDAHGNRATVVDVEFLRAFLADTYYRKIHYSFAERVDLPGVVALDVRDDLSVVGKWNTHLLIDDLFEFAIGYYELDKVFLNALGVKYFNYVTGTEIEIPEELLELPPLPEVEDYVTESEKSSEKLRLALEKHTTELLNVN